MSRMPRRGRPTVSRHNDSLNRFKQANKIKGSNGIQLVHSPLRKTRSKEKTFVNRCCYVTPVKRDFSQYYAGSSPSASKDMGQVTQLTDHVQFATLLQDQYGYEPAIQNIAHLKELKKVPCDTRIKFKTGSQRAGQSRGNSPKFEDASDEPHWQKVDSVDEVDKLITSSECSGVELLSKHIFISKVPRVKVIVEKFSKYKRGSLELRRLDEKVVCVEYDIFDEPANGPGLKPVQKMRAFFSIKPSLDNGSGQKQATLPLNIKNEFEVFDEDLQKLTEKEIEFIDSKIEENKSYLEDLRRILKRKHVIKAQKNKTTLDLQSLYEMAKEYRRPLNCDFSETNLLSKAELQEVKDLILQRCTSSVHGFSRRTLKRKENGSAMGPSVISEIIMSELLRSRRT